MIKRPLGLAASAPRWMTMVMACALLSLPASAQTTGAVAGRVVDAATHQPVSDAVVVATSPQLQGEQSVVTDASGAFEISLLPSGVYTLNVNHDAYKSFTQAGLKVSLDRTVRLELSLQPEVVQGGRIVVDSEAFSTPAIATTDVTQGGTVDKNQISMIPYGRQTRSFEAVATSIPGVHESTYGVSVNGAGSPETSYVVDGVSVNDPAYGTQGTSLVLDFIQEVDIKTGGFQAEYGRSTGGVINVVTKSGSNEFHGSVFANWSPFEASRRQFLSNSAVARRSSQKYNLDFGAEIGGPILKDKLWFYFGAAPQLQSVNYSRVIQKRLQDAATRQAAVGSNGLPIFQDVASQDYTQTNTSYQFTGKLTYLLNENHNIALSLYGDPNSISGTGGTMINGPVVNGNLGSFVAGSHAGSVDSTLRYSGKLFEKSMLLEASVGYHHQFGNPQYAPSIDVADIHNATTSRTAAQMRDTPAILWNQRHNLLDFSAGGQFDDGLSPDYQNSAAVRAACSIQADGFDPCPVLGYATGGLGGLGALSLDRVAPSVKLTNFAQLAGHHVFKYGVDAGFDYFHNDKFNSGGQYFRVRSNTSANGSFGPDYGTASDYRIDSFRNYGHADPNNPNAVGFDPTRPGHLLNEEVKRTTKNLTAAAYAQDTWSILDSGVALDVGIRAERQVMQVEGQPLDAFGQPFTAPQLKLTNFMPRVGLTYDFTNRGLSKVYASYGRFYEYVPLDLADRALAGETQIYYRRQLQQTCVADPRACTTPVTNVSQIGSAEGVEPNLQGQYSDQYQGGVQYQVYRDITVGVDFVHNQLGRVIEDMSLDDGVTYFLSNPGEQGKLGYQATTGSGASIQFPKPRRVYDGITLRTQKQFSDNWLLTASWTLSALRGNYPGLLKSDTGQLDPNITSEYDLVSLLPNRDGPLPGDHPNSFKLDAAYVYPLDARTSVNLGGSLIADQGSPLNVLGSHPIYGSGEGYLLPRGSGGRLPWDYALNLRAQATHKLTQDYSLAFRVDLFNVTNHQTVLAQNENYTLDSASPIINGSLTDLPYLRSTSGAPVTLNPNYGLPTQYRLPFSARVGATLSF